MRVETMIEKCYFCGRKRLVRPVKIKDKVNKDINSTYNIKLLCAECEEEICPCLIVEPFATTRQMQEVGI